MRQTREKQKPLPPLSIRLTLEERARLQMQAGRTPLSVYVREQLFNTPCPRKRNFRQPVKDDQTLASVLSSLGQSRLASNLNQLARASHTGSLPVTPDVETVILEACSDVRHMRQQLMKALGLMVDSQS